MKKFNIKLSIFLISTIIVSIFFFLNFVIGNDKFKYVQLLKSTLNTNDKDLIKKYIFPYQFISQQQQKISEQQQAISQQQKGISQALLYGELFIKEELSNIKINKSIVKLSNNLTLEKYKLTKGFYYGISQIFPGSGYIDFYKDNIIIISSLGLILFSENLDDEKLELKKIKNNVNEFIGLNEFKRGDWFSIKDLLILKDKVFISYTEEIKDDCWNIGVIYGDMNNINIEFRKLFSAKECIHRINNIDKEFNAHQSGGRMISFDDNHILLSVGDFRERYLAQDEKSINGKIIKININNNKDPKIIAMGLRNSQGLYFDKINNFILVSEHGPQGGDEINLIEVSKIIEDKIQNYGWPISSYGEHYLGKINENKEKYKKYPLYKSHSKYGFIEPLKVFTPGIGVSEIVLIGKNKYVLSSMADKSLYFFELNEQKQLSNLNRVEVFERVRDLKFKDNKLYLFLEDTASIGVINID
jgi:hypothetical protein